MDEFFLEQHYRQEERDQDFLPYYKDSGSSMIDETIKDFNGAMSGEDEAEDEDYREDMPVDNSDFYTPN